MDFEPGFIPPSENDGAAWWFLFRGKKLLIERVGGRAGIPCMTDPADLCLSLGRKQYLGTLDGRSCYAADCGLDTATPKGLVFSGLRRLFGLVDEEMFQVAGRAFQIVNWDQNSRFCGRCGEPTMVSFEERLRTCPKCGLKRFPRLSPAVIAAVTRGKQILLARADRFPGNLYSVLAGFVEPGETLEDCLRREVREEVGLEISDIKYFGSQPWPFPDSLMIGFTARYAGGEITVDDREIVDAGWYAADRLPNIPDKISIARRLIDWFVENNR